MQSKKTPILVIGTWFVIFVWMPLLVNANDSSNVFFKKGWFGSIAISHTSFTYFPYGTPTKDFRVENVLNNPAYYIGYRIAPNFRIQAGVLFNAIDLDEKFPVEQFYIIIWPTEMIENESVKFLIAKFNIRYEPGDPGYIFHPYIAFGPMVRSYWMRKFTIVYDRNSYRFIKRADEQYHDNISYLNFDIGCRVRIVSGLDAFLGTSKKFRITKKTYIPDLEFSMTMDLSAGITWNFYRRFNKKPDSKTL